MSKRFFRVRKVEMSDHSNLYELVTPDGERVASATTDFVLENMAAAFNDILSKAEDHNIDFVVNA